MYSFGSNKGADYTHNRSRTHNRTYSFTNSMVINLFYNYVVHNYFIFYILFALFQNTPPIQGSSPLAPRPIRSSSFNSEAEWPPLPCEFPPLMSIT